MAGKRKNCLRFPLSFNRYLMRPQLLFFSNIGHNQQPTLSIHFADFKIFSIRGQRSSNSKLHNLFTRGEGAGTVCNPQSP